MSPSPNVQLVHDAFAAADGQDRNALFACLAPQVQWHMLGLLNADPVRRGREAVWELARQMRERFDGLHSELSDPEEIGGQVVIRIHSTGRGRGGNADLDVSYTAVFQIRDGRIASAENFEDHDEALTEATLRA